MMATLVKRKGINISNMAIRGKRKVKAMNIIWYMDSDNDNNDSNNESFQSQEINFALMTIVEDNLSNYQEYNRSHHH
jgi:hypothetical protein